MDDDDADDDDDDDDDDDRDADDDPEYENVKRWQRHCWRSADNLHNVMRRCLGVQKREHYTERW